MIVKDEADVIRRALQRLKPLVDHWVIVDTGSTDATKELIEEAMDGLPGELHDRPWVDFGHNRSEAVALARDKADYLLFFDADDILEVPADFRWPPLVADAYYGMFGNGERHYDRLVLVSNRLPWRFEGVLHEYPTPDQPYTEDRLPDLKIVSRREGARSKLDPREKYGRDARVLAAALEREPDNARHAFYYAKSLQDAGQPEAALAAYERRAGMVGWVEETWYALLQIAQLKAALGRPPSEVITAFLAAHESRPVRAEALGMLARYLRLHGERWPLARLFATGAASIPMTTDRLFVDRGWYQWRSLDELAVAAFWCGEYDEARSANLTLLARDELPSEHRGRIRDNLAHCERRLSSNKAASTPRSASSYSIWIVSPPNYRHGPVFDEIALALQDAFAELGEVVPIVQDAAHVCGQAIVLGAGRLSWIEKPAIPQDAILFNLEQVVPGTTLFDDTYLGYLRSHQVWDYSEFNLQELHRLGVPHARKCGIGYSSALTRIAPATEQDIDVLFYGSISGRRIPILERLEGSGLKVKRLFGCYGAERDAWIARSKLVLNLHAHEVEVLEIARISYLLANRKCVVSEPGRGSDTIERQLADGIAWAREDALVETCKRLCADAGEREAIARRGFRAFSVLRQVDYLMRALADRARP